MGRKSHHAAAGDHEKEASDNRRLVAEPLPDGAAGQRKNDTRHRVEANQNPDICQADTEICAENGGDGGDALKLHGHRGPNEEENSKHAPAIAHLRAPAAAACLANN